MLVVGGILAGLIHRMNRPRSPNEIINRVELALKNNNAPEAVTMASQYVKQNNGSWQGRYALGKAMFQAGRMDQAIQELDLARRMSANHPAVLFTLADVYALPARAMSLPADPREQTAALEEIISALTKANKVLADAHSTDPRVDLDIRQQMGLNLARRAEAKEFLARQWSAKNSGLAGEGREMAQGSKDDYRQAIDILLGVIKADPQREQPGMALIEACNMVNDQLALAQAAKAILLCPAPPPAPTCLIVMQQLQAELPKLAPDQRKEVLARAAASLERLGEEYPHNVHILTARAQIAYQAGEVEATDRLCQDIFLIDPTNQRALLLQGNVLLAQGQFAAAEAKLHNLAARYPLSVEVLLAYAKAARAAGKTSEAWRTLERIVGELDKNNQTARQMLSELP